MANSSIEWTELTWNPTTGCDKVFRPLALLVLAGQGGGRWIREAVGGGGGVKISIPGNLREVAMGLW